jgi:hypothetical protein
MNVIKGAKRISTKLLTPENSIAAAVRLDKL